MCDSKRYLTKEYNENIPDAIKKALEYCTALADEQGLSVFLIGGIVRDIIIKKQNFDVDITVQGNAVDFAQTLQDKYPDICKVKEIHDAFKTAKVQIKVDGETIDLDLASTRKESYPYPSSLPQIEEIGCKLYEDVIRRDFTVNSMALSLNKNSFCELVDYLGGYENIQDKKLEILHDNSFVDDPTRIIRGLKFSIRFGYKFGENTKKLMQECLDSGRFDNLAGERIKQELKQTLNLNKAEGLERLVLEDILRLVNVDFQDCSLAQDCEKLIIEYYDYINNKNNIWLIYFGILTAEFSQVEIREISKKMYLSGAEEEILIISNQLCKNSKALNEAKTRFDIYEFFEKTGIESMLIFLIKNQCLKDKLDLYLQELKNIAISSNGDTLIKLGLKPGPLFGDVLRKVLKARINKKITAEEELEFIKKIIN